MKVLSLQARIMALVLSLVTVVWLLAAAITWIDAQEEIDELLDSHLAQAAALLVLQADGDDDEISEAPPTFKYAPAVAFQVYIGGQLITRSSNVGTAPLSYTMSGFSTVRDASGDRWRVFATHNARHDATAFVGEKTGSRRAILWALMRSMLWPMLIALPLFAVATWWSIRLGLKPLSQLSVSLGRRRAQAIEPVPLAGMQPELVPLVEALNALLDRISRMVILERQFTADAAHELRTPIAGIRAQAQVAMGAGNNTLERDHALEQTLAGCDRATRLVEQLLTLARLEVSGATQTQLTDLSAVARSVAAALATGALARHQSLELVAAERCPVAADEALLSVLVRNLVDNALRYSPDGATVLLAVRQHEGGVEFSVQDSGPGMTPEQMARLGERFYRVMGSEQPGSGLGWSIVRRLADVFKARIAVARSDALGGLSVTVRWPR